MERRSKERKEKLSTFLPNRTTLFHFPPPPQAKHWWQLEISPFLLRVSLTSIDEAENVLFTCVALSLVITQSWELPTTVKILSFAPQPLIFPILSNSMAIGAEARGSSMSTGENRLEAEKSWKWFNQKLTPKKLAFKRLSSDIQRVEVFNSRSKRSLLLIRHANEYFTCLGVIYSLHSTW